ncbi:phage tail protein [Pseudomonas sp. F(2018)]|uniref:phage tail protein n=1 Tax=Pseudomonas sp. F(2018) TaxID=2502240 RepID=UPI0010F8AD21|nr:phage tail protein [Pseudomonas sp. F(2018)]
MDWPHSVPGVSLQGGKFTDGNPLLGIKASLDPAAWANQVTQELVNVITAAGFAPSEEQSDQLLRAIRRLRGGAAANFGQWAWSGSLAGNPGAGSVALNNATPSAATTLFIAETSAEEESFVQSLSLLRSGDTVTFQERFEPTLSHRFRVTGPSVDHGSYRSVPVEHLSGSGGLPAEDTILTVLLTQAGASASSVPLFSVQWWPSRTAIPAGYAPADGQALPRATWPDAWAGIQAGSVPTVAEATWTGTPAERGKYTVGDGATTFRLPDYNGKAAGSLGAVFQRGDGALSAGVSGAIQLDEFKAHNHSVNAASGAVTTKIAFTNQVGGGGDAGGLYATYDKGGAETRPLNVTGCWIIKLHGAVTNPGSADAAQLATDYAALVARVAALEARPRGLGDVQSWQHMNASRVSGTTYTNTTGRPILVHVSIQSGNISAVCQGVTLNTSAFHAAFVVPNGATYSVTLSSAVNLNWAELR